MDVLIQPAGARSAYTRGVPPRRKRRVNLGTYRAPAYGEPPPISDVVDEGVLVLAASVRLSVKNQAIVRILRDQVDYDPKWYRKAVRKQLLDFAEEKSVDVDRLNAEIESASEKSGRAEHQSDYRRVDLVQLERRRKSTEGLVERLRALADDKDYVDRQATASRELALDELGVAIRTTALGIVPQASPLSAKEKKKQLDELQRELAELLPPD